MSYYRTQLLPIKETPDPCGNGNGGVLSSQVTAIYGTEAAL